MSTSPSIPVNPDVLRWAREESGYPTERVAVRLNVNEERVRAWEKGERQPTERQLEELAKFLRRPLGIFFLSQPPRLAPLGAEYRRLPGVTPGRESPELRIALRQMLTRRETALGLMEELGEKVEPFSLRAHLRESAAEVAARLRLAMGVDVATQLAWPNEWRAWAAWRSAAESLGLFVFLFPSVALDEVRGLAILRDPFPVVAINSKEMPEARAFTLFHELVHVLLAAGNEELPAIREQRPARAWDAVERFAESVASYVLIPEQALREALGSGVVARSWNLPEVRSLARRFRVTPLAMATRLRESGHMTWTKYDAWRHTWDEFVSTLRPRRGGFATRGEKAVNRAGRPFAALVLEALAANRITSVDAARFLNLKFEHFEKLGDRLREDALGAGLGE
ncbi:MAG: ImmA/IrrE family metallo-endopeptidase [Candidatus Eisenbacteria bacterium]|uniref:ImmA/IrrE family metallo-endopeptidase n=1 Tax=Eiseniibacteriota bacterium TaxID=2212470 RepID=A0A538UBF9_UNCEI|nr:MAG: ImmA/IrrE family metallo-endopeptidase [Candidatus Eisenbacteria bacterium]